MEDIFITVFTPSYNRGYIINNLYESLQQQEYKNFEWIVIDDGSTDKTEELFSKWTKEYNEFPIKYLKVSNGGKHRAINKAVNLAKGQLFFIVDSDDKLTSDALLQISKWEKEIPHNGTYAGVAGAKGYTNTKIIGTGHGRHFVDATSQERVQYGITGDKAEVFYTNILKQFPFPEFEGENFITESVVWFAIGKAGYKIRWYDKIIYICDYLDDGLSKQNMKIFYKNPNGFLLAIKSDLSNLKLDLKHRLSCYAIYKEVGNKIGKNNNEISKDLNVSEFTINIAYILRKLIKILKK